MADVDTELLSVLRVLAPQKMTVRELVSWTGHPEGVVRRGLARLRGDRLVQTIRMPRLDRPTVAVYWLTPAGHRRAAAAARPR